MRIIFLILVLSIFGISSTAQSLEDYPEYFKLSREIEIPSTFIVGSIKTLSIYQDSIAVFVDPFSEKVFWLDLYTNEMKKLDPEICHPGFETIPLSAFFLANSNIFITNATIQGYWFNLDGSCGGGVADKFVAPFHTNINKGHKFPIHTLTFLPYSPEDIFLNNLDEFGNTISSNTINTIEKPILSDRFIGGGIVSMNENIYISTSESSKITEVNLYNAKISISDIYEPSYIKRFPINDISKTDGPEQIYKYFNAIEKYYSLNLAMYSLSKNLLIQQISFKEGSIPKIASIIYDTVNKKFLKDIPLITSDRIYYGEHNKVYVFKSNQDATDNEIKNPSIMVYEYVGPNEIK